MLMASTNYNKSLSIKNLVIGLCVVIGIILIVLYCYKWHQVKEEEKYLNSYLISSNTISLQMNDISEIESVLSETPNYYFVYISYTGSEDVYSFEKEIQPLLIDYDLQNNFYYLNITDIKKNNSNYKKDIAKALNIDEKIISEIPVILYYKDGKIQSEGITTIKDFENLLTSQGFNS